QQSNAQLADVITHGQGNMPAFGNSLSIVQIDALVKYLRSLRAAKYHFAKALRSNATPNTGPAGARGSYQSTGALVYEIPAPRAEVIHELLRLSFSSACTMWHSA